MIVDIMKLVNSNDLSEEQKDELLKRLQERKRERQAVMSNVDQDLAALEKKTKE